MKRWIRKCYIGLRVQMRLLRLRFTVVHKPDDAKTPEEMFQEIKKRLDLT